MHLCDDFGLLSQVAEQCSLNCRGMVGIPLYCVRSPTDLTKSLQISPLADCVFVRGSYTFMYYTYVQRTQHGVGYMYFPFGMEIEEKSISSQHNI